MILSTPFVFGLLLLTHNFHVIRRTFLFLRYGGEWINYENNEKKTIYDIYQILKKEKHGL